MTSFAKSKNTVLACIRSNELALFKIPPMNTKDRKCQSNAQCERTCVKNADTVLLLNEKGLVRFKENDNQIICQ